jgi:predicted NUDIX family phosphoesterase
VGNPDELVLVVPRESIVAGEGWLGIRPGGTAAAIDTVAREGRFMRRGDAEEDPAFKQVIPYLVLRDGDAWFLMWNRRPKVSPEGSCPSRPGGLATTRGLWLLRRRPPACLL